MGVVDNDDDYDDVFYFCASFVQFMDPFLFLPHDKFSQGVCMTFDFYVIQFEAVHNHLIFQLSVFLSVKEI